MIMQEWHAATTTRHSYTLTYQFLTDLQTFTRPRVSLAWPDPTRKEGSGPMPNVHL